MMPVENEIFFPLRVVPVRVVKMHSGLLPTIFSHAIRPISLLALIEIIIDFVRFSLNVYAITEFFIYIYILLVKYDGK